MPPKAPQAPPTALHQAPRALPIELRMPLGTRLIRSIDRPRMRRKRDKIPPMTQPGMHETPREAQAPPLVTQREKPATLSRERRVKRAMPPVTWVTMPATRHAMQGTRQGTLRVRHETLSATSETQRSTALGNGENPCAIQRGRQKTLSARG
jgi:hypothetical protein